MSRGRFANVACWRQGHRAHSVPMTERSGAVSHLGEVSLALRPLPLSRCPTGTRDAAGAPGRRLRRGWGFGTARGLGTGLGLGRGRLSASSVFNPGRGRQARGSRGRSADRRGRAGRQRAAARAQKDSDEGGVCGRDARHLLRGFSTGGAARRHRRAGNCSHASEDPFSGNFSKIWAGLN